MTKVRHVLGISGGKDSAALSIYLKDKYPDLPVEYYFTDTGKELDETYSIISRLEGYLGKRIELLTSKAAGSGKEPFDYFLQIYGGFLPSSSARWCTQNMKLDPFEKYVGDEYTVSYVGIRGDENREGYISKKKNIQSIFPFRRNIWSEDIIRKVLPNSNIKRFLELYRQAASGKTLEEGKAIIETLISPRFNQKKKLDSLLDLSVSAFNETVFRFLQQIENPDERVPLSYATDFPLITNEDNLIREDIFSILRESGVGVPKYYDEIRFEATTEEGVKKTGVYKRSRSGCFFCFYQQKIEWVWLLERHPDLFAKAMEYEIDDQHTWMENETLAELAQPERVNQIKLEFIERKEKADQNKTSNKLMDILDDGDVGCASCFI